MREFLDWYENDAERLDILATFVRIFVHYINVQYYTDYLQMNFHIHQMRGEDICSLRNKVFAYAGKNGTRANFGGHGASKSSRGFNNPDSGRLNCPMRDITEFDDEGWMA